MAGEAEIIPMRKKKNELIHINLLSRSIMLPRLQKAQDVITSTQSRTRDEVAESFLESQEFFWKPLL